MGMRGLSGWLHSKKEMEEAELDEMLESMRKRWEERTPEKDKDVGYCRPHVTALGIGTI